ncbi:serine/threonine-protein phosphatase, partial [Sulfitobacter sp. CW3]|nr:serine/threonine-protein phosphatase [Sulfitobacter sp. CW3]
MTPPTSPASSAARSERGKARQRNEDAFLDCPQQGCWVVADGMGGHRAGHMASQSVVDSLAAL